MYAFDGGVVAEEAREGRNMTKEAWRDWVGRRRPGETEGVTRSRRKLKEAEGGLQGARGRPEGAWEKAGATGGGLGRTGRPREV